jgi:hypothetical protein
MKTALWLLAIELAVLLVIGAAAILFVQWRRARRDRAAVSTLVATVRAQLPARKAGVRDMLGRTGMLGQVLDEATDRFVRSELKLYEVCANSYLDRDAGAVARLNATVDAAINPYWSLGVAAPSEADVVVTQPVYEAAEAGINPAEYERLKDENQRLSAELQVTLDTMSRMLSEYSAMFAGGADAALDKQKLREMFEAEGTEEKAAPGGETSRASTQAEAEAAVATVAASAADAAAEGAAGADLPDATDLMAVDDPASAPGFAGLDAAEPELDLGSADTREQDPDLVEIPADADERSR